MRAELKQHRFLEPLIYDPLAVDLLSIPRFAGVEQRNAFVNVSGHGLRRNLRPP